MENYKNRTSFTSLEENYLKGSFYSEIKNFMEKSRKHQTLYANFEGSYNRRVLDLKHKNTLENFIYSTLYFNGSQSWDKEQNFSKRGHVERITYEMIKTSKSFQVEEEIHFGVAWIYYFCYEDKTQKATPVFKIYKSKTGNEAVFLDVSLISYSSWECYLDASLAKFPVSFLCLPRNGNYCFLGSGEENTEGLDLEFVCSKKLISKNEGGTSRCVGLSPANYMPFCEIAVRPWLNKISLVTADVIRKIKRILATLWSDKVKKQCLNFVVFGLLFLLRMIEKNVSFVDALKLMESNSIMLLNTILTEDVSLKDALELAFLPSPTTSIPSFSNFDDTQESSAKFDEEGDRKSLLELLKAPKKNWYDILRVFCDFYRKNKFILKQIVLLVPLSPILNNLFLFLNGFCCVLDSDISDPGLRVNPTGSFQCELVKYASEAKTYLEDVESKRTNMALEKVLSNLSGLETIFSKIGQQQFFEESFLIYERHRQFPTSDSSQILANFVFLGKADCYGLFFIPCAFLTRIANTVDQLLEGDVALEPEKNKVWKVVLQSGQTVGHLFFPNDYCALALFSLEAITEQARTLLESESFFC